MVQLIVTFNIETSVQATRDALSDEADDSSSGADRAAIEAGRAEGPVSEARAIFVGNPNVGKSVVFGALTGTHVAVSNYPGTTVELTTGKAKHYVTRELTLLDTPGTNSLSGVSEDEAVTRDVLLASTEDAIVQIGDGKSLARTLLLTLQLADLERPLCLNLNMMDEARSRGLALDLGRLADLLPNVRINSSTAIDGVGIDTLAAFLDAASGGEVLPSRPLHRFEEPIEAALARVEQRLPARRGRRALALILLSSPRDFGGWLEREVPEDVRLFAAAEAEKLAENLGTPLFARLAQSRMQRAKEIADQVQRRSDSLRARARPGRVSGLKAAAFAALTALLGALVYDTALTKGPFGTEADPLETFGVVEIVERLLSAEILRGHSLATLPFALLLLVAAFLAARKHAQTRAVLWKGALAAAVGYGVYAAVSGILPIALGRHVSLGVHLGAFASVATLGSFAVVGDSLDARLSRSVGELATHRFWGVPILIVLLFYSYKVVGVFGAKTCVDFVEKRVFGAVLADAKLDEQTPSDGVDTSDDGAVRILVATDPTTGLVRVAPQTKSDGLYKDDPELTVDVYSPKKLDVERGAGGSLVRGDVTGATARVWSGPINRMAYRLFDWLGISLLTGLFVGSYGLITMGLTYALALMLPIVATFFFVFSLMEDSGYLPRLAVMANRGLSRLGLNGKAVLPMVLGLGCDTMATLTARIMETKKERILVTFLLALGIPCSSQLAVVLALMQRTSKLAAGVWALVLVLTLLIVGAVAARVVPGERSDFLLELPPIRRPMLRNIVSKTMARIEWYLKEAVPLFLIGTFLLFVLDSLALLPWIHRAGEPIVHHALGFARDSAVSAKVSEALLIGFLRRDFGAAGLLELAKLGQLSAADVAVSMVTITLFIPCIAQVFMIAKERGVRTALLICGFIFPYAIAMGALVRLGFRVFGGA